MWLIESSGLGRIAVPPEVPEGFAVFATTADFPGRITGEIAQDVTAVVRERFGVDAALSTCAQVHGANVERVGRSGGWRECDRCDALWSDERNVALGIKVADCLPVTMIDPSRFVIANVHSGWRGAVQRITAATIEVLRRSSAFDPEQARVYLGPSLRSCCFEVGEEVASQFDARWVERTRPKPHVDLVAFTVEQLRIAGVDPARISDSGLCTRCDGSIFHSYRRDAGRGGRNLAIVAQ